jgi:hypothetical protein
VVADPPAADAAGCFHSCSQPVATVGRIDGVGRVPDTERNQGQFDDLRECVSWGTGLFPWLCSSNLGLATLSLALPGDPRPAPGPGLVGPDLVAIAPSDRDILRSRSVLLQLPLNRTTSVRRVFYLHIALRKFPILVQRFFTTRIHMCLLFRLRFLAFSLRNDNRP